MRALSPAFALLMIAAGALGAVGVDFAVVGVAVVAVAAGVRWAGAATLAVGCVVVLLVRTDPPPTVAAIAGIAATAYLVTRFVERPDDAVSRPTVATAMGLSAVALLAAIVPVEVVWLPLAVPVTVLAAYVVVVRPFLVSPADAP